ncbi:MAG: beta-ribofuranosylaminobenzene 5'-phosphate synthase [Methanosarcinaceae archaeon]|nr:beta-ribofuranosylaminobenzene 5'-phosphate synthase [Methanosarcinaceae archaeon]
MIKIRAPSRLHLTLIDLNAEMGRVDGGIGITLASPCLKIFAEKADSIEVFGKPGLSKKIENAALAILPEGKGIRIQIKEDFPDHVGFGSGTQAALSAATAVNELYNLGKSVTELALAANRGTTSGVGVAAFEKGGFLLDGGHRFREKNTFSHDVKGVPPGLLLSRFEFPDWPLVIAVPNGNGVHDEEEVDIFKKVCPIPLAEVREVSHLILMQLLPALLEKDPESFGRAINRLQRVGFKKRELALQPFSQEILTHLQALGCYGAGMSSFGPLVYGLPKNLREASKIRIEVQKLLEKSAGGLVFVTKARNRGAEISYEEEDPELFSFRKKPASQKV